MIDPRAHGPYTEKPDHEPDVEEAKRRGLHEADAMELDKGEMREESRGDEGKKKGKRGLKGSGGRMVGLYGEEI